MKKVIVLFVVMIMVVSTSAISYGNVNENSVVSPHYNSVLYYTQSFTIDDEGIVNYSISVYPFNIDPPDRVTATINISGPDGETIFNGTRNLSYNAVANLFLASDSHDVRKKGTYTMSVTFKCYSGNTLIETISALPKIAVY